MPTAEVDSRWSLAVAQTCPVPGDVAANVDQHLSLARDAAAAGASLVLFPELAHRVRTGPRAGPGLHAP